MEEVKLDVKLDVKLKKTKTREPVVLTREELMGVVLGVSGGGVVQ